MKSAEINSDYWIKPKCRHSASYSIAKIGQKFNAFNEDAEILEKMLNFDHISSDYFLAMQK